MTFDVMDLSVFDHYECEGQISIEEWQQYTVNTVCEDSTCRNNRQVGKEDNRHTKSEFKGG